MNDITILDIDLPKPRGHAPIRRPLSIRRTASIDVTWPNGPENHAHFFGRARDIFTPADDHDPEVIQIDELFAEISADRTIRKIRSVPARDNIEQLLGVRGGDYLRTALNDALPEERKKGSPLYLLIDDLAGASLVCNWALICNNAIAVPNLDDERGREMAARMQGVCIGFRPGSSALDFSKGMIGRQKTSLVSPLHHPNDPEGWHPLDYGEELSFRRARRIDVWVDGDVQIDATFQDSAARSGGEREAVHEYSLHVTADPDTLLVRTIEATPHILPFPECPNAIEKISRLVGTPVGSMRTAVLETFPGVLGCTHLNDCMRSIAEVPVMYEALQSAKQ